MRATSEPANPFSNRHDQPALGKPRAIRRGRILHAACETVEARRLLASTLSSAIPGTISPAGVAQELFAPGINNYSISLTTNNVVNSSFRFVLNNALPGQEITFRTDSPSTILNPDAAIALYDSSGNRIALQDQDVPLGDEETLTVALESGKEYVVGFYAQRGFANSTVNLIVDTGAQALGTTLAINPATNSGTLNTAAAPDSFSSSKSVRYIPLDLLNAGATANLDIAPLGPDTAVQMSVFLRSGDQTWVKQSTRSINIGQTATQAVTPPSGGNITDGEYMLALAPLNFTASPQPVSVTASTTAPLAPATITPSQAASTVLHTLNGTDRLASVATGTLVGGQPVIHGITAAVTGPMYIELDAVSSFQPLLSVYSQSGATMIDAATSGTNGGSASLTIDAVAGTTYYVRAAALNGSGNRSYAVSTIQNTTATSVAVGSSVGTLANLAIAPNAGGKLFRMTPAVGSKYTVLQLAPNAGSNLTGQIVLFGSNNIILTFTASGPGQPVTAVIDSNSNAGPYEVFVSGLSGTGTAALRHATLAIPASLNVASLTAAQLNIATGGLASAALPTSTGTPTGVLFYQPLHAASAGNTTYTATSASGAASILLHYIIDGGTPRLIETALPNAAGVASVASAARGLTEHAVVALPINFSGSGTVQLSVAGPIPTGIGLQMVPNALPGAPTPPGGYKSTASVTGARLSSSSQRDIFSTQTPFNLTGNATTLEYVPGQSGGPLRAIVSVLDANNNVLATQTSTAGGSLSIPVSGITAGQTLRFDVRPVAGSNLGDGTYGLSMTVNTTNPLPYLVTQTEFLPFSSGASGPHFPNAPFIPINFGSTGGSATGNFTSSTPYANNGTGSIQVFEITGAAANVPWQVTTTAIDPGVNTNFAVFYFNSSLNKYTRVPGTAPSFDYFPADRSSVDARIVVNNLDIASIYAEGEFGGPIPIYVVVMNEGGSRGQYRVTAEPAPVVDAGPGNLTPASILVAAPRAGSTNLGTALTTIQTVNGTTFTLKTPSDMNGSNGVTSTLRVQTRDFSTGQTISVNVSRGIVFAGSASGVVGSGGVLNLQLDNNTGGQLTPILGPNQTYQVTVTASSMPSLGLSLSLTVPYITPTGTVPPSSVSSGSFPRDAAYDSTVRRIMPSPTGALSETLTTSGGAFYRVFTLTKNGAMNFTINSTSAGSPAVGLYRAGKSGTSGNFQDVSILMDFDNTRTSNNFTMSAVLPAGTYWLRGQGFDNAAPVTITGSLPAYPARVLSVQPGTGLTTQAEQTVINRGAFGNINGLTTNGFTSTRYLSSFFKFTVPSNATGAPVTFSLFDRLSTFAGQTNPVPPVGTASLEVWRFQNNTYTRVNSVLNLVTASSHSASISAMEPAVPGTEYFVGVHFNGFQYASYVGFDVPVFTSGVGDYSAQPISLTAAAGQTLVQSSIVNGSFASAPVGQYTFQLGGVTTTRTIPSLAPFGSLNITQLWSPGAASDVVAINANPTSAVPELSRANNSQSVALSTVDSSAPSVTIQLVDTNMTATGAAGPSTGGTTWGRYIAGVSGQTSTIRLVGSDPNADLFQVVATLRNANGTFAINSFATASGSSFTSNIPIDFGSLGGTTASNQNKINFYAMDKFGLKTPILIQSLDVATPSAFLTGGYPELEDGFGGAGGTITFNRSTRTFKYDFRQSILTLNRTLSELLSFNVPFIGDKKNQLLLAIEGTGTSTLNPNLDIPLALKGIVKVVAVDKEVVNKTYPGNYNSGAVSFTTQVTLNGKSLVPGSASATFQLKNMELLNLKSPEIPLFRYGAPGIAELKASMKFALDAHLSAAAKLGFDPTAGSVGGYFGSLGVMSPTFIQPTITGKATLSGDAEILGFDIASLSGTIGLTLTATLGLDNALQGAIIPFANALDNLALKIDGLITYSIKAEVLWYDIYEYTDSFALNNIVNTIDHGIFLTDPPSFAPGKFLAPGGGRPAGGDGGATPIIKGGNSLVGAYQVDPHPQLAINNSTLNGIAHSIQVRNVGTASAPLANLAFTTRTGGVWSPLTTIPQTTDVTSPELALTNDGANSPAVVVYGVDKAAGSPSTRTVNQRLTSQEIRYRYFNGTSWGAEQSLTNDALFDSQQSIAFNSAGAGVLAFVTNTSASPVAAGGGLSSSSNEIRASLWNPTTHTFGAPVTITSGGGSDSQPATFVDASGKAYLTWINTNNGVSRIMYATSTGGAWSAPAVLGISGLPANGTFRGLAMGSDGAGRVNVIFSHEVVSSTGQVTTTLYQRPSTTAAFTSTLPAVQLSQNANFSGLRTTNTPGGALVAYWQQSDGQENQIFQVTISQGVAAGPTQISTSRNIARSPSAAVDGDGKIQLVYNDDVLFGGTNAGSPNDQGVGAPTATGVQSSSVQSLPQLTFVSDLAFPLEAAGSAPIGSTITGTATIANRGLAPANVTINAFNGLPAGGTPVGTRTIFLAPGATYVVSQNFVVGGGTQTYSLQLTTPTGQAFNTSENVSSVTLRGLADLQAVSLTNPVASPAPGSSQTLQATVKNNGATTAPNFVVTLYAGDPLSPQLPLTVLSSQTVTGLAGSASRVLNFPVTLGATAGDNIYTIMVDPAEAIEESSELNNRARYEVNFRADPSVSTLDSTPAVVATLLNGGTSNNAQVVVKVSNLGITPMSNVPVNLAVTRNGGVVESLGQILIPTLAVGATQTVTFTVTARAGENVFIASIDSAVFGQDSNLGNNTGAATLSVAGVAALSATGSLSSASSNAGNPLTLNANITNAGLADAANVPYTVFARLTSGGPNILIGGGVASVAGLSSTAAAIALSTAGLAPGAYTITLRLDPNETIIEDNTADNTLTLSHTISASLVLAGPAHYVRRNADGVRLDVWNGASPTGSPDASYTISGLTSFTVSAASGSQNLTIDFSNGNPLPASGLAFNGPSGGTNALTIVGTGGVDQFNPTGNTVRVVTAGTDVNITRNNVGEVGFRSVGNSDVINLSYASGNPLPTKLKLDGTFTMNGFQNFNGTTLDMGTSTLRVSYSPGNSVAGTIRQYLTRGYNNGAWNGAATSTAGSIHSSAATSGSSRALGYADFGDGRDVNLVPNTVLIKFAHQADTDLDGVIDFEDLLRLAQSYGGSNLVWDQGDFNYDGVVDFSDLLRLAQGYGQTAVRGSTQSPSARSDFGRYFSQSEISKLDELNVFQARTRK